MAEVEETNEAERNNPMIDERRIGMFRIDRRLVFDESQQENLLKFSANFLVVRCEYLLAIEALEYVAYSPLFEPTPAHTMPPTYLIQCNSATGEFNAIRGYQVEKQ